MSKFGWSYPPGCTGPPDDDAPEYCQVCFKSVDDCICPVCPVCLAVGDPQCYEKGHLTMTGEQKRLNEEGERLLKEEHDTMVAQETSYLNDSIFDEGKDQ